MGRTIPTAATPRSSASRRASHLDHAPIGAYPGGMEALAERLSQLDSQAEGALRVVMFYDTLMRRRVDLPALARPRPPWPSVWPGSAPRHGTDHPHVARRQASARPAVARVHHGAETRGVGKNAVTSPKRA